jgi:hypothetical protein
VAAYLEAGLAAADSPYSREARASYDQATYNMLQANSSDPEVNAFLRKTDPGHFAPTAPESSAPTAVKELGGVEEIFSTASRDYLFGSTIDSAGIWVGEEGNQIKQNVGQFIQDHPGIGIALTLADAGFAIVAPAKYLGGKVLDYFKDEATGYIAGKMTGPELWAPEKAQAGGSGFVLAGGIALSGLGALGGVGGILRSASGHTTVPVQEGVDLALTYKPGWSAAQRALADQKVKMLTEENTVVSQSARSGTSAASRYRKAGNSIPKGSDIDHKVDLQLGGSDTLSNMWPLDSSVNRSLGAQIHQQIKNLPTGTVINRVTIGDR